MSNTGPRAHKRMRINPMSVWRWGFGVALLLVGVWLVIAAPSIGETDGRVVGWVIVGYALLRLLLSWTLKNRNRSVTGIRRDYNTGESA